MTSRRAKMLIVGAWILSFVICFPPLVGWNEDPGTAEGIDGNNATKVIVVLDPETVAMMERCQPQCRLIQEPGYVIYSAVGSFYAPMLVMMFFNWRIFTVARKTTKAIRQGFTKVKGEGVATSSMGIHRGGGGGSAGVATGASASSLGPSSSITSRQGPFTPLNFKL
jgi:octopamine receptor